MDCNDDGKTVATKLQEVLVVDVGADVIEPVEGEFVREWPVDVAPSDGVEVEDGAELELVRRAHDPCFLSKSFSSRFL